LLEHILRRLAPVGEVWVATTTAPADDAVADVADTVGVPVHRGSENDVLDRFAGCVTAMSSRPDLVVRMAADRPFASAELVTSLVDAYEEAGAPDYLSNMLPRKSYPDGLDVEVVPSRRLLEAAAEATDPYDREHVTPFFYRQPGRFRLVGIPCPYGEHAGVRLTIDTEDDYERLRLVAEDLGADVGWRALLDLAVLQPERFS
jgi:spore coat polysaccharide biosynthesis protein SpsF